MKLAVFALLYVVGGCAAVVAVKKQAKERKSRALGGALGEVVEWVMLGVLWPLYAPFVWGEASDRRRALAAGGELALLESASPPSTKPP